KKRNSKSLCSSSSSVLPDTRLACAPQHLQSSRHQQDRTNRSCRRLGPMSMNCMRLTVFNSRQSKPPLHTQREEDNKQQQKKSITLCFIVLKTSRRKSSFSSQI